MGARFPEDQKPVQNKQQRHYHYGHCSTVFISDYEQVLFDHQDLSFKPSGKKRRQQQRRKKNVHSL